MSKYSREHGLLLEFSPEKLLQYIVKALKIIEVSAPVVYVALGLNLIVAADILRFLYFEIEIKGLGRYMQEALDATFSSIEQAQMVGVVMAVTVLLQFARSAWMNKREKPRGPLSFIERMNRIVAPMIPALTAATVFNLDTVIRGDAGVEEAVIQVLIASFFVLAYSVSPFVPNGRKAEQHVVTASRISQRFNKPDHDPGDDILDRKTEPSEPAGVSPLAELTPLERLWLGTHMDEIDARLQTGLTPVKALERLEKIERATQSPEPSSDSGEYVPDDDSDE